MSERLGWDGGGRFAYYKRFKIRLEDVEPFRALWELLSPLYFAVDT